jgi:hypothetical protein
MRHTLPPAVLDRLVGERVDRLRRVPAADRTSERPAPAAEALDEGRELEQVRARAGHLRQRAERRPPCRLVAEAGSQREREERRVVPRRPALRAHAHDLGDRAGTVFRQAELDRLGVLPRERRLRGVVATALGAEHEKAPQLCPAVDRPGEAARGVRHLARAEDRRRLARPARADALQVTHREPPFVVSCLGSALGGSETMARRGREDEDRKRRPGGHRAEALQPPELRGGENRPSPARLLLKLLLRSW